MTDSDDRSTGSAASLLAPNLEALQKSLHRILIQSDTPVVVALKGGWGEGKTYFWQKSFSKANNNYRPGFGYVSVFGPDSLGSIRNQVAVEAAATRLRLKDGFFAKFKARYFKKIRLSNIAKPLLSRLGLTNLSSGLFADVAEQYAFTPSWILCLDDVERLSEKIDFDAFLGYVNSLRDDSNLKIVLIYNDEKVAEDNYKKRPFERYLDKVIDHEFPFVPDLDPILDFAFGADILETSKTFSELRRRCIVLGLRNIRILKRVRSYYSQVKSDAPTAETDFLNAALYSLLLFSWIRYSKEDALKHGLSFDYLQKYTYFSEPMLTYMSEKADESEEISKSKVAASLLEEFGYSHTDDLDQVLINFVRTGHLDHASLVQESENFAKNVAIDQLANQFRDVWQTKYHSTLRDTTDEFCSELARATRAFIAYISLNQLDQALVKLSQLGHTAEADDLFDLFLEKRGATLKELIADSMLEPLEFDKLRVVVDKANEQAVVDQRSLDEVIESAASGEFISDADIRRLSTFSKKELVDFFSSAERSHLTSVIRHIFRHSKGDSSEAGLTLHGNISEAVVEIASQSELNRQRMVSMGLISDSPIDGAIHS